LVRDWRQLRFTDVAGLLKTTLRITGVSIVGRAIGTGRMLEVESVSAGPASCSVKSGNVFAE
jgi:hypothetical protein